jgi:single-stranded-DNA-specific exonuclease
VNDHNQWKLPIPVPEEFVAQMAERAIHPIVAQILYRRGFADPDQAVDLLAAYHKDDNPFGLKGMTEAVYRLRMAIRNREAIAVYGDFDCDGVSATVVLTQALLRLGANVRPYIPSRVDEGYGLNSPALQSLAEEGIKLVVTVDCGIRSVQEVADGNRYGLDIIISDHHSLGPEMPPALAVINPKQEGCAYPEKMLAGVGLAYKVAQALYMEAHRRGYDKGDGWHPSDWLDLVAIGTVADIAPLIGENRMLVQDGLKKLNSPQRPGLKALYGVAGVKPGRVSATTIGFLLGPRINAAGRLRSASLAFDLLSSVEMSQAVRLAEELNSLNQERQQKTDQMQGWAEEILPADLPSESLLFAADPRFEQGVVGLVASRLTEAYYRPSVVVQMGDEESHGSCRSIPEFHITHALDQCSDLLERHGGHAAAAGFTVRNDRIDPLRERLHDIAHQELDGQELIPSLNIDAELPLGEVSFEVADALAGLEPTGEANRMPLFIARDLSIVERRLVGAEGKHLKLALTDGASRAEAIAFRMGAQLGSLPERIDVAYHLEADEWNERRRLQLNLRDIRPAAGLFEG